MAILTNVSVAAFFYPQESSDAVEFHKSQGMGGRLTQITDIAPLVRFYPIIRALLQWDFFTMTGSALLFTACMTQVTAATLEYCCSARQTATRQQKLTMLFSPMTWIGRLTALFVA